MADSPRLIELRARRTEYRAAESAILAGAQSYQIGSRRLDRAQLYKVTEMIEQLDREIAAEEVRSAGGGRIRTIGVIPRDF